MAYDNLTHKYQPNYRYLKKNKQSQEAIGYSAHTSKRFHVVSFKQKNWTRRQNRQNTPPNPDISCLPTFQLKVRKHLITFLSTLWKQRFSVADIATRTPSKLDHDALVYTKWTEARQIRLITIKARFL